MQVNVPLQQAKSPQHMDHSEFLRLLEVMPAAAYTCDGDGLVTYFNKRAAEVWGREPHVNDPIDRY